MRSYRGRILLVDDDKKVCNFYATTLDHHGYVTVTCHDLGVMRETLDRNSFDAVFLDLNLGEENGMDGLPYVLKKAPHTKVFVLTSQDDVAQAVSCMDRGASWYFTKGMNPEDIITKVDALLDPVLKNVANRDGEDWTQNLVGNSDAIRKTCDMIRKLKDVDSTVLILGESGTGKEVIARALHSSSTRNKFRFEAINCGAIPENLLESELFGHKKGSFTDAKADRKGIFEICSDGTLLLDEIGDMPIALQTKLLRVLQEKEVTPIGSSTPIKINTRVIAATHRDVLDEIKSGRFREDLYYRLSVVVVEIPALRHRKEDIVLLVNHFLEQFNKRFLKEVKTPNASVLNRLLSYDWPGNIRELQNTVERGVVLADSDSLSIENMFSHLTLRREEEQTKSHSSFTDHEVFDLPLTEAKQVFEKYYLERHLKQGNGNVAELARRSGRYRADLYRMLERYDIKVDDFREDKS